MNLIDFKPILKPGTVVRDGKRSYFESSEDPITRVLLPPFTEEIVPLLNGRMNCQELFSYLAGRQALTSLYTVLLAVERLATAGLLKNSDDWTLSIDPSPKLTKYGLKSLLAPLADFVILDRSRSGHRNPLLFYTLSMVIIFGSLSFLHVTNMQVSSYKFFQYEGSYLWGILFLFLCSSALISFKHVIKTLLLYAISGEVFRASLRVSVSSIAYKVDEEVSVVGLKAREFFVYSVASLAAPFLLVSLEFFLTAEVSKLQSLLTLALLISLIDWNPQSSTEMVQIFWRYARKAGIPYFHRVQRESESLRWILQGGYSAFWTLTALKFLATVLEDVAPLLLYSLHSSKVSERIPSAIILGACGLFAAYIIYDAVRFIVSGLSRSLNTQVMKLKSRLKRKSIPDVKTSTLLSTVKQTVAFLNSAEREVEAILNSAKAYSYKKGLTICLQNTRANHLIVVTKGVIGFTRRESDQRISVLGTATAPFSLGEVGLLNSPLHEVDGFAETDVELIAIPIPKRLNQEISENWHQVRLQAERLQRLRGNLFFRNLPFEVLNLLFRLGSLQKYSKNTVMLEQNETCSSVNFLVEGAVEIWSSRQKSGQIFPGACFGDIALAYQPAPMTYVTSETSLVFSIRTETIWSFLYENIQNGSYIHTGQALLRAQKVLKEKKAA